MNIFYMGTIREKRNRVACLSDLEYYFKRSDLLGGLTDTQKGKLRENIGVAAWGEGAKIIQRRSHAGLLNDMKKGIIIPGARYTITDFQSIYASNNVVNGVEETWGSDKYPSDKYELLLTGISNTMLDPRVYITGKDWEVEYDITQRTLPDGQVDKGRITKLIDSNGNSAHYDFKNIRFKRTRAQLHVTELDPMPAYVALYTFSSLSDGVVKDRSEEDIIKYNELKSNCWNNVFIGDSNNNIFESECVNNTFIGGCTNCHFLWETKNNTFTNSVGRTTGSMQGKTVEFGNDILPINVSKQIHIVAGATVVTYLDTSTYSQQVLEIP